MSSIPPISTVRVSDSLIRTRLTEQVQSDQLDLFRLQTQLSTGRRIFTPSEDAPAALRAITLQRNLERQTQLQQNLTGSQQSLSAAGNALGETSNLLNDIRAAAISVTGTDATQEDRDAVAAQVDVAIETLLRIGNSEFQDNFLFGGSFDGGEPFVAVNNFVEYRGNEQTLQAFVDSNLLFDVNITGQETLGGISDAVRGSTDLGPQLTPDTLLSQLNAGTGVSADGAIQINFLPDELGGEISESTIIDLRAANTVGDVARLLEAGAPPEAGLRVSLVGDQLAIETSGLTPGSVTITEVGQGQTAQQLGIEQNLPSNSFNSEPLEPTLRLTTQLDTLFGARAQARLIAAGVNNDLIITATQNGERVDPDDPLSSPLNGVQISLVDGGTGATPTAVYDPGDPDALPAPVPPTLVIEIEQGVTTTAEVAEAINNEPSGLFTAEVDLADALSPIEAGQGAAVLGVTAVTSGGAGTTLDLGAGLQVVNGEGPVVIDTSNVETVFDLLEEFNQPGLGLVAELNSTQTGIDVRTRRSGADFAIGENGGQLATQLGLRTFTVDSELADFNRGIGVAQAFDTAEGFDTNNVFRIALSDQGVGQTFEIDLDGDFDNPDDDISTVADLLQEIANVTGGTFADGAVTGGPIDVTLSEFGNGLTITRTDDLDPAAPATGTFTLTNGGFDITAATPGVAGNNADINVVIEDGAPAGAVFNGSDTITVTLDITNDPAGSTVQAVADAIDALGGFTTSNVTGGVGAAIADDSTTGGALTGGFDTDAITISGGAAERFGFLPPGEDSITSTSGAVTSEDRNTFEVDSAFNTLLRLRDALEQGDVVTIGETVEELEVDLDRATFAQAEIGFRVQTLQVLESRLEDEEVQLRSALSDEIDVDLTEAISDFVARQFALQASLQTTANLLQLSILDFI